MHVLTSRRVLKSAQKRKKEVIISSADHACADYLPPGIPLRSNRAFWDRPPKVNSCSIRIWSRILQEKPLISQLLSTLHHIELPVLHKAERQGLRLW